MVKKYIQRWAQGVPKTEMATVDYGNISHANTVKQNVEA